MTLLERKTRYDKVIRLPDKSSRSVMNAFAALKSEYGERFPHIFKTITTDNGSEFSRLAEIELESETKVYYARPYSSCEKGSNERHNGLVFYAISFQKEDALTVLLMGIFRTLKTG